MKTVKQLRELAKAYDIKGYSRMKRDVLQSAVNVAIIEAARKEGLSIISTKTSSQPETSAPATTEQQVQPAPIEANPVTQTTQNSEPQAPVQEVKPQRKLPTPKNPRGLVADFSPCKDAKTLRKMLNGGTLEVIRPIAESFKEFQPRTDGKPMTKKFYVDAIVRLYFPDEQPKAPAPIKEAPKVSYPFVPGEIYIKCKKQDSREIELVKVLRRKGEFITVQEVSYPELEPMCKPVRVKLQHDRFLTQEGFLLDSHDIIDLNHKTQDCVYSHPDYKYYPEYYQPRKSGVTADEAKEITSIPAHDMDFDETAYTPERQDNLAVLDDIPADHEPDIQPAKPREPWQEHICDHCNGTPNWTHDQFIRGIQFARECKQANRKASAYISISTYLWQNYSLIQLRNLAKFFGLNVPAIKLTGDKKSMQKSQQIAHIIAEEICDMEHVYVCKYEYPEAPELPAELAEHAPKWEKEMIARTQAMPAPVQKSTPKHQPAPVEHEHQQVVSKPTTRKPRHAKNIDSDRQIFIPFDEEDTPASAPVQPAKPKPRRTRKPRIKRDYSRQILIDFGEDIPSSQTNQRKAA